MDAHQSVVPPLKHSIVVLEPEHTEKSSIISDGFELQRNSSDSIGVLEVFIHQARDIHNICIYHKQDVYAKVSLTSDPEQTVSTKIINGGGKNPVFNENLRLNIRTVESSLKCEVWMLSRVRNYLEDQLLGFALVPLLDVLTANGKLSQEFSLSSTDLFHSPAGFVQLSLSYDGAAPEVMEISHLHREQTSQGDLQDSETTDSVLQREYDKIEFPDPKIVNENEKMVSEYFGMPCTPLDSEGSECLNTPEDEKHPNSDLGVKIEECLSAASSFNSVGAQISESTHTSSASTDGSPTASSQSYCNTPGTSNPSSMDLISLRKEKGADNTEAESETSSVEPKKKLGQSALMANVEPEQAMLQQEIVDMYMKSMQQFTESLAKMKLPMDIENMADDSVNKSLSSDQKSNSSKANSQRVFYGSRAFF